MELYRSSGQSIPKVAKELGIADESLRRWIRQHEIDEGERDGLTLEERQELSRQCRENKTLRQEREFLKKAACSENGGVEAKSAPGLVHHSDPGVHPTSASFSERLREVGITPSMGRTGTALDNA